MVDVHDDSLLPEPASLEYTVEEQALVSKTGKDEDCEDAIYIGPNFAVVIDGATSKTERRWDGKTGGRIAAEIITEAFDHIPPAATARQTVDILTAAIQALYKQYDVVEIVETEPVQRAIACFVAVSFERKEVWLVGDCQCLLDQERIQETKRIDDIAANARSFFLEAEVAQGKTIEELHKHDTGREFILPLLERQMYFQNNSTSQYWFPVIDGFDVPDEGIHIESLPTDIETIILASDGYPYLKGSLEESEQALQELLRDDPLLFRKYRSTKGLSDDNISYDDRSYLKLKMKITSEV